MVDESTLLAGMLFFGFVATEGLVEYSLGTLFERVDALEPYNWTLMYVSLGVGIFLALHYSFDAPHVVLGLPASPVGTVLTGLVMGRGANFVADVWSKYFS